MITEERLQKITTREECERNLELCSEELDSADLFTIISAIADYEGYSLVRDFLNESQLPSQLVSATQSNYEKSWELIREMAQYADRASELEEGE